MKNKKTASRDIDSHIDAIESELAKEKNARHSIRSQLDYLEKVIDNSLNLIVAVDEERRIVEFNKSAQTAFGYKKEEVMGKHIDMLYASSSEGAEIAEQIREKGSFQGRVINLRKNGEEFTCMLSASFIHSDEGKIIGAVGNSRDITEDIKAEKALQASEETARVLLNSPVESIILIDGSGIILDLNESAIRALAAEDETPAGQSLFGLLGEQEKEILIELVESCVRSGIPARYESEREVRLLGDAKFKVRFKNTLYPIRDNSGWVSQLALFSTELAESASESVVQPAVFGAEKDSEVALKLFRATVRQLPGIVWCVDKNLRFTLSDGRGLKKLGLKSGQVVGMTLSEFRKTDKPDAVELARHMQVLDGEHVKYKTTFGSNLYSCSMSPLKNDEGEIIGALGIALDVTELDTLEKEVEKEKVIYRELVENIDEIIFSLDTEGRFNYISPAVEKTLGYSPDEVIGHKIDNFILRKDRPLLKRIFEEVLSGTPHTQKIKLPTKGKKTKWVRISTKPIYSNKHITGISGIIADITTRKDAKEALEKSEKKYLDLIENLPVGVFRSSANSDGRFIMANEATAKICGFDSVDELLGTPVAERYFDPNEYKKLLKKIKQQGILFEVEQQLVKPDGTVVWCLVTIKAVKDKAGKTRYLDGLIMDITGRKSAEEALQISEERFKSIAEGSDDWIWEIGPDLRIRYSNASVRDIIGYEPEEVIGFSLLNLMCEEETQSDDSSDDYTLFNDKIFAGHKTYLRHKKGNTVITESSGIPIFRRDRSFVGFQGLTKDVTEAVKAREEEENRRQQLIQADKMISLGILVAGVAHEINNPNQFIMINIPLLKRAWEKAVPVLDKYYEENGDFPLGGVPYSKMRQKIPELHAGIYNGAQRIKNIVKSLKDYAREGQPEIKTSISVNEVLQSSLLIVANQIKKATFDFQIHLGKNIPPVKGNFQRLEQVVINLIQNACQALDDPQKAIEIKSKYDSARKRVLITIRDEGIGIEQGKKQYILDPFYSSKRDSGGTGLGLSISAGIIKDHDGTMNFRSVHKKGTTVTVSLPVLQDTNSE